MNLSNELTKVSTVSRISRIYYSAALFPPLNREAMFLSGTRPSLNLLKEPELISVSGHPYSMNYSVLFLMKTPPSNPVRKSAESILVKLDRVVASDYALTEAKMALSNMIKTFDTYAYFICVIFYI